MKQSNQKQKLLLIINYLTRYSDELHPVNMNDILTMLENNDIKAERKSIYDDIKTLQGLNYDIIFVKTPKQGYFLSSRLFERSEVKIISDAIASSNFLTHKKTVDINNKLLSTCTIWDEELLKKQLFESDKKFINEQILYSIDKILIAIQKNNPISFLYFDYTIDLKKKYRRESKRYNLIPYALIWHNNRYYCIMYSPKHESFTNYRVDKMDHLDIIDEQVDKLPFDIEKYLSTSFEMTFGDKETITIRFDKSLMAQVIDEFGPQLFIQDINEEYFTVNMSMALSSSFISWILHFGNQAKVLKPASLVKQIKTLANTVLDLYQ